MPYKSIHEIIVAEGYQGSVAFLRMFVQKERYRDAGKEFKGLNSDYQLKEYVQRKSLTQLMYSKIEHVYSVSKEQIKKTPETYPMLAELYSLRNEFYEMIYSRKPYRIEIWIQKLYKMNITKLNTYASGISKDLAAVKNGIILSYNNGFTESSVNKIKVIKRIMYGANRAGDICSR